MGGRIEQGSYGEGGGFDSDGRVSEIRAKGLLLLSRACCFEFFEWTWPWAAAGLLGYRAVQDVVAVAGRTRAGLASGM